MALRELGELESVYERFRNDGIWLRYGRLLLPHINWQSSDTTQLLPSVVTS
jgi:hypothetical protein